jgi:protoporphyrinogen oxidase
MTVMRDIGVLGGGISGLFVARFLGGDVEVLESDERVGGLARSFGSDGFLSDIGGHILFSKDEEALAHELHALGPNIRQGIRKNRVLYKGLHVKYPFENGIDALPKEEIVDILATFIENPARESTPTNFREWLYHVFGAGLTDRYLLPYNEKIWKTPAASMSTEWVDRVPRPPLRDLLRTGVGIQTEGYTHQLFFKYPDDGGFEALPRAVAAGLRAKITTGFRVTNLAKIDGGWAVTSANGETREYRQIVCTLPVNTLFAALGSDNVPAEVRNAANDLRFNSLRVVLVGVEGPSADYTALYVADPRSLYHRVCYNHVFSPKMCPPGTSSVSCEITVRPGSDEDGWSDERLLERCVADLVEDGIIQRERIVHRSVHRERYAYVVYDLGYAQRVKTVREFCDRQQIHLAGRFAEYRYVNTDACVRRALDLSRELRGGTIAEDARLPGDTTGLAPPRTGPATGA